MSLKKIINKANGAFEGGWDGGGDGPFELRAPPPDDWWPEPPGAEKTAFFRAFLAK